MNGYPVHYAISHPPRFHRFDLLVRVIAFLALGVVGLSFGTLFFAAYLALPVYAATRLGHVSAAEYLDHDGARIARLLAWLASICAWAALIADRLPASRPDETVTLEITPTGAPASRHAILRVFAGIPSALVLALLCCIGCFVWLWAAVSVLVTEKVGDGAFHYLVGLQRWSIRLLAYQASLVDEYPPFSFGDVPPHLPAARVAP